MSDVAAYHVFVCALFPVQGDMWTPYYYLLLVYIILYMLPHTVVL